jgi:Flp pilus assembly protein TadG
MPGQHLARSLRAFGPASQANLSIIFALALLPIVGAVGAAVDYSQANSLKSAMQSATDATALAMVSQAATLSGSQLGSTASSHFLANFNRPTATNVAVSASYNSQSAVLTVNASANSPTSFLGTLGIRQVAVSTVSKATLAPKIWPVCVLIAASTQKHTLFTMNNGHIDFDNCMVQVNTTDWDAVEARDISYIHSKNGDNCFVGQIHYGDVQPPKDPTCTFFPDPFAGFSMPASAATCTYTNFTTTGSGMALQPGTYCGNTTLNGGSITLAPGLYIVKSGNFVITGNTNVVANGVTFVLTGTGPNFYINTNAQLTQTPMASGQFAGFAFYLDNNSDASACLKVTDGSQVAGGKKSGDCVNSIDNYAKATISGVVYLANAAFLANNNATVNVNGSFVSAFLVASNNAQISLTGALPTSSAIADKMQKAGANGTTAALVQ